MKVTNDMISIFLREYSKGEKDAYIGNVRPALEAIFEHVGCQDGHSITEKPLKESIEEKQPNNDGWINWKGGECPINRYINVEIKLRDKTISINQAQWYNWEWDDSSGDIIAYRIIKQEPEKKVYKLSEMWKGWWHDKMAIQVTPYYITITSLKLENINLIAITRADATEFFEGEGL